MELVSVLLDLVRKRDVGSLSLSKGRRGGVASVAPGMASDSQPSWIIVQEENQYARDSGESSSRHDDQWYTVCEEESLDA